MSSTEMHPATDTSPSETTYPQNQVDARLVAALIDLRSQPTAVLDAAGVVCATNSAWNALVPAAHCFGVVAAPGTDYLALCRAANIEEAHAAADGIQRVLAGAAASYRFDHQCIDANAPVAHSVHATPLAYEASRLVAISYERPRCTPALNSSPEVSEPIYRAMVEHIPHVTLYLATLENANRTFYISPQFEQMVGFSAAEWLADPELLFKQIHPKDRLLVRAAYAQLHSSHQPVTTEFRLLARDRRIVWVNDVISVVHNIEGQPLFIVGQLQDIGERRHYEAMLRASSERLEVLHSIDRAILAARSPAQIAEAALSHIYRQLHYKHAWVILFDFVAQEVEVIAEYARGTAQEVSRGQYVPILLGRASIDFSLSELRKGRNNVFDVSSVAEQSSHARELLAEGIRYFFSVPLLVKNELLGVLQLGTAQMPDFDDGQQQMLGDAAASLAIALNQANLYEQVSDANIRLRELSVQLVETQEIERRRLARDLHDQIGQLLAVLNINLAFVRAQLAHEPTAQLDARIEEVQHIADEAVERLRDVLAELRPPVLDDYGLTAALRWYVPHVTQRLAVAARLSVDDIEPRLSAELETALFRIAQEALTNVARHAHATRVTVRLQALRRRIRLTVTDDGVGFDTNILHKPQVRSRLGLSSMRERCEACGGSLRVISARETGTRILVEVPR